LGLGSGFSHGANSSGRKGALRNSLAGDGACGSRNQGVIYRRHGSAVRSGRTTTLSDSSTTASEVPDGPSGAASDQHLPSSQSVEVRSNLASAPRPIETSKLSSGKPSPRPTALM